MFMGGAFQDKILMDIMDRMEFNEEDKAYLKLKRVIRILSSRLGDYLKEVYVNKELMVDFTPTKPRRVFLSLSNEGIDSISSLRMGHNNCILVPNNGEKTNENYGRGDGEEVFSGNDRKRIWRQ